jgi:MSHA biogenesis protein MshG
MATFRYKARDSFSRPVSGTTVADNRDAAAKKLQELNYVPISIEEVHEAHFSSVLARFNQVVKPEEISAFTRQLYSLQKAGLPLLSSLESVIQQTNNRYFKAVIEDIASSIRGGLSFSESLKRHGRIFDGVYVAMIKAAESGGNIVVVLEQLVALIERDIDTRSRIKAATQYPVIAFVILCIGFLVVVTFVIPRFAAVYSQFQAALPLPTRILIGINLAIHKYWFILFPAVAALIYAFIRFINTGPGRTLWDNFKLKIPVLGPLVTMMIMSRFARVTAILMKSGVPILEVFDLVASTSGNVIISRAILGVKESVNQGKGISEPMKVSGLFPAGVIQMVAVGEQTGRIDQLLMSVADYYDTESGYMIKNLTTYIEPILIIVLGGMILVLALGIFMPMWNLMNLFKQPG